MNTVRCHECGQFAEHLGAHIQMHKITAREYKKRHDLTQRTRLSGIPSAADLERWRNRAAAMRQAATPEHYKKLIAASLDAREKDGFAHSIEKANLHNSCKAQLIARIKIAAQQSRHTPTSRELLAIGIHPCSLKWWFGSLQQAMVLAGLEPRNAHC